MPLQDPLPAGLVSAFQIFAFDTQQALASTYAELEALADKLDMRARRVVAQELEGIAAFAAFAARYFDFRSGMGASDPGHEKSLRAANTARRQTRRALGYRTTPDMRV